MPHLISTLKKEIDGIRPPSEPGHITYKLYKDCLGYLDLKGESFATYCVIMGALICTMLELYRLKVARYEDKKILENGEAK